MPSRRRRDSVWKALNDPATLKACIPGCESIEPDGLNVYRMAMAAKVGPVSARFTGRMRLDEIQAPQSYTLRFDGTGGVAGFVNGEAHVTLTPADDGTTTTLAYTAKANVGGKLAQVGSRLIDGVAHKYTDEFFVQFVAAVTPAPVTAPVVAPLVAPAAERIHAPARRRRVYFAVGVAVLIAVSYFMLRRWVTG